MKSSRAGGMRCGAVEIAWPPRSPDMKSAIFFLWGLFKDLRTNRTIKLDQLKASIATALEQTSQVKLDALLCEVSKFSN